jgi:rsbT co-antagonist protein RsbR
MSMKHWFNNASIRVKISVCAITILAIVGAMTGAVYVGIVGSQARDERVILANDVVTSSDALLLHLTNMEMSYRSYLLTNSTTVLRPYEESYQAYTQEIAHAQELVRDDAAQVEQLREIDKLVQAWRTYVHQPGIQRRKALGNKVSAGDVFIAIGYRGQKDFDDIRQHLSAIRASEIERSEERRQEASAAATMLRATLLGGMVVVSILSLGTLFLLANNISRRVGRVTWAATQIAGGNSAVRCELPRSRDEVGVLAETFNTMAGIIQRRTDDLATQYTAAEAARCEAEAAHTQIASQLALIEEQEAVIRDMSVPVLPLTASTLVMPLVGALDSQRLARMQEQALKELEHSHARQLILDITGVPIVDTQVARGLIQLVQAARMLGTGVSIVGIRPEVAQALVGLGVDLSEIHTHSTLQQGIAQAIVGPTAR